MAHVARPSPLQHAPQHTSVGIPAALDDKSSRARSAMAHVAATISNVRAMKRKLTQNHSLRTKIQSTTAYADANVATTDDDVGAKLTDSECALSVTPAMTAMPCGPSHRVEIKMPQWKVTCVSCGPLATAIKALKAKSREITVEISEGKLSMSMHDAKSHIMLACEIQCDVTFSNEEVFSAYPSFTIDSKQFYTIVTTANKPHFALSIQPHPENNTNIQFDISEDAAGKSGYCSQMVLQTRSPAMTTMRKPEYDAEWTTLVGIKCFKEIINRNARFNLNEVEIAIYVVKGDETTQPNVLFRISANEPESGTCSSDVFNASRSAGLASGAQVATDEGGAAGDGGGPGECAVATSASGHDFSKMTPSFSNRYLTVHLKNFLRSCNKNDLHIHMRTGHPLSCTINLGRNSTMTLFIHDVNFFSQ
jgi:hypothetical protein